jgi:signal transduction histidine kinase
MAAPTRTHLSDLRGLTRMARDAGEVTVDVGAASVVIRDTGVGIAPGQVDAMYQPFVRGDVGRRGGHGVGLTIVRRLSDRFGWPVAIDSSPGVGTRVEIGFPQARSEPLVT